MEVVIQENTHVHRVKALVASETHEGAYYIVSINEGKKLSTEDCSCPHFQKRGATCKHINAVQGEINKG